MFRLWLFFVILQFLLSVGVVFAKDIKSYSEIPEDANPNYEVLEPVSYTHLTLPTMRTV